MKDLIISIIESAKERLKSPFIGAFVFAWICFNWKAVFTLLFSDITMEMRISLIEKEYEHIRFALWYPLVASGFYVLVLPYVTWLIDLVLFLSWRGRKANLKRQKIQEIQNKRDIAIEEIRLQDTISNFKEKEQLNNEIESLRNSNNEKESMIVKLNNELSNKLDELNRMKFFSEVQRGQKYSDEEQESLTREYKKIITDDLKEEFKIIGTSISRNSIIPHEIDDFLIEKFISQGIINRQRNNETGSIDYSWTRKGEFFWNYFVNNFEYERKQDSKDDFPF